MKCPDCNNDASKAIYLGLPMNVCLADDSVNCWKVYGFWSFVCEVYFNGVFMLYRGSYLKALYAWVRGSDG